MVFSSELFIYGFLPVFFSLYYFIADQRRNWLILAASLIFYSVGAGSTVLVLLASIWINQFLAIRIESAPPRRRRALLAIGIAVNLLGLAYYKYGTFIWQLSENFADAIGFVRFPAAVPIPLPIGISFFTFQAISYLIDIYRRNFCRRQLRRIRDLPFVVPAVDSRSDRALSRDQVGDAAARGRSRGLD
jgi:alginate O-acetyltransferase complex protein AlgI